MARTPIPSERRPTSSPSISTVHHRKRSRWLATSTGPGLDSSLMNGSHLPPTPRGRPPTRHPSDTLPRERTAMQAEIGVRSGAPSAPEENACQGRRQRGAATTPCMAKPAKGVRHGGRYRCSLTLCPPYPSRSNRHRMHQQSSRRDAKTSDHSRARIGTFGLPFHYESRFVRSRG